MLLVGTPRARADEPITIETTTGESAERRTGENEAAPMLQFDPTLRVAIERLDHQRTTVTLGPISVHGEGAWRAVDPAQVGEKIPPMWRTRAGASIDLGFARLEAHYGFEHVENELGAGLAKTMGAAVTRTFRLFGKDAFVKLTLDRREWRDHLAPPGEFDATTVMLWFGLRW